MGDSAGKQAIDLRIAKAFVRQRYPLSEEGQELRQETLSLVAIGKIPAKFAKKLPTVEKPRLELFADFDLTPEQENEVFGWELSTIQSHYGCTHQCEQCYKNAPHRLSIMPFAAIGKIAAKKWKYDKLGAREWLAWEEFLRQKGVVDLRTEPMEKFLETATDSELLSFLERIMAKWKEFDPKTLRMRVPFKTSLLPEVLRKKCVNMVPFNISSIINFVFNYEGNDPLEYRDSLFLHKDGTPADYGDVFKLMSSFIRPVVFTTAGWFPEDKVACRAIEKIIKICKQDKFVNSGDNRISISYGERHFLKDPEAYFDQVEAMIRQAAPIKPMVSLYYEKRNLRQKYLSFLLGDVYVKMMKEEFGIKHEDQVMVTPISHLRGRAATGADFRKRDWDPDQNVDGIHIRPNGEVSKKAPFGWRTRKRKNGEIEHFFGVPKGSDPEPTGIWLYHLNEQKQ